MSTQTGPKTEAGNQEACLWIHVFGPVMNPVAQREFERVMRYIATIERGLDRSTIRLTQLQETRRKRDKARPREILQQERRKFDEARRASQLVILEAKRQAAAPQSHTKAVGFVSASREITSTPPSNLQKNDR